METASALLEDSFYGLVVINIVIIKSKLMMLLDLMLVIFIFLDTKKKRKRMILQKIQIILIKRPEIIYRKKSYKIMRFTAIRS